MGRLLPRWERRKPRWLPAAVHTQVCWVTLPISSLFVGWEPEAAC